MIMLPFYWNQSIDLHFKLTESYMREDWYKKSTSMHNLSFGVSENSVHKMIEGCILLYRFHFYLYEVIYVYCNHISHNTCSYHIHFSSFMLSYTYYIISWFFKVELFPPFIAQKYFSGICVASFKIYCSKISFPPT